LLAADKPLTLVTELVTLKVTVPLAVNVFDPTAVTDEMPGGNELGGVTTTEPKPEAMVTDTAICVVFPANTVSDVGTLNVKPGRLLDDVVPVAVGELNVPLSPLTL
jgi:hypothetical protein